MAGAAAPVLPTPTLLPHQFSSSMPHGDEGPSLMMSTPILDKRSSSAGITDKNPMSIDDTRRPSLSKLDIPNIPLPAPSPSSSSPLGYHPPHRILNSSSSPVRRSPSLRLNPSPDRSLSSPSRRSKLASPVFTSLREKDDPYFLALPDASRSKILSNSAPDLNTLPHPPPRVHRRPNRDSLLNGNGRSMEQLHSSRRHSTLCVASQQTTDNRPLSRRSSIKPPFRLGRTPPSSGSSSPNYGSDSESEIFDDDHSNVGSTVSTRPSSFSSTASFNDTLQRPNNADGKIWKRGSLTPSFSALDLRKQAPAVLPERDHIETEDCRFLESEYQRYNGSQVSLIVDSFHLIHRNNHRVCVVIYSPSLHVHLHYHLHLSHC